MEIWTPYSLVYIICVTELSTIIEERDPPTQSSKMNIVPVPKCHVANYRGISIVRVSCYDQGLKVVNKI